MIRYPAMARYQLQDQRRALIIFYGVMVTIMVVTMIVGYMQSSMVIVNNGMEISTVIFLFVCGLNSFKETFYLGLQNGVSRRRFFVQTAIAHVTLALLCAVADSLLHGVSGLISANSIKLYRMYQLLGTIYPDYNAIVPPFQSTLQNLALSFTFNAAALALGQFITVAYYRMGKAAKLWVSIGVPVLFTMVLPLVDAALFHSAMGKGIERFMRSFLLLIAQTPIRGMLLALTTAAVLSALSFMMIRGAQIRN